MSKSIVIADDSKTVRSFLASTLSSAGYQVMEAADGVEAFALVQEKTVDALITDLNMPNMGGVELIKAVRSIRGYRFTPIIMLTSETQPELKNTGKSAGASLWLNKPFKEEQVLSIVKMVCPL